VAAMGQKMACGLGNHRSQFGPKNNNLIKKRRVKEHKGIKTQWFVTIFWQCHFG
jgi:hypothetical protein